MPKLKASRLGTILSAGRDVMTRPAFFKSARANTVYQASEMTVNCNGDDNMSPGQRLLFDLLREYDNNDHLALTFAQQIIDQSKR